MNPKPDLEALVETLGLLPLPQEGGLFRQTYISPERMEGDRPCGTAILYLLTGTPDSFSALHRLPTDEIWHFYLGDPLEMTLLFPDGASRQVILGPDVLNGQQVQFIVPRGVWQGTRLLPGGEYALAGTTMAPGFTWEGYEHGDRADLSARYPGEAERIAALTRER